MRRVRPVLAELARAHLLTERLPGRYAFHDLLRAYATELTVAHDPADRRQAATVRLLDHYLHTAHAAAGDPEGARRAWRRALTILTDLDHPDAGSVRAKLDSSGAGVTEVGR